MQTFLPFPDFVPSARALDQKRLGKQRVETIQVLRGLIQPGYGWRHHPAVKMWTGYEEALVRYGLDMCGVWVATGRADTTAETMRADLAAARGITVISGYCLPYRATTAVASRIVASDSTFDGFAGM